MNLNEFDSDLRNKSVLITGASGFVGRNLLSALTQMDCYKTGSLKITCVTRDEKNLAKQWPNEASRLQTLNWEITNPLIGKQLDFDYIFHLAGENRVAKDSDHEKLIYKTSTQGTRNLLTAISSYRANPTRVILASSGAVYSQSGKLANHFVEPSSISISPTDENDPYKSGKIEAEKICKEFTDITSVQIVIARMFAFVGPFLPLDKNFAVGNFMLDCLEKRPVRIKSDGTSLRTYQNSLDMVRWLTKMLLTAKNGEIYNVGSDEVVSIIQLAELVAQVFQNDKGIAVVKNMASDPVSKTYVPSIKKAKRDLGLINQYDLRQSIEMMRERLVRH